MLRHPVHRIHMQLAMTGHYSKQGMIVVVSFFLTSPGQRKKKSPVSIHFFCIAVNMSPQMKHTVGRGEEMPCEEEITHEL